MVSKPDFAFIIFLIIYKYIVVVDKSIKYSCYCNNKKRNQMNYIKSIYKKNQMILCHIYINIYKDCIDCDVVMVTVRAASMEGIYLTSEKHDATILVASSHWISSNIGILQYTPKSLVACGIFGYVLLSFGFKVETDVVINGYFSRFWFLGTHYLNSAAWFDQWWI